MPTHIFKGLLFTGSHLSPAGDLDVNQKGQILLKNCIDVKSFKNNEGSGEKSGCPVYVPDNFPTPLSR